jgi:hypothetical protein
MENRWIILTVLFFVRSAMGFQFWSFYSGGMMALTSLAGFSRDVAQSAAAPIVFGGLLLIIATVILEA